MKKALIGVRLLKSIKIYLDVVDTQEMPQLMICFWNNFLSIWTTLDGFYLLHWVYGNQQSLL